MAVILPVNGVSPQFGRNCFIAENATVVGDVVILGSSIGDNRAADVERGVVRAFEEEP